MPQRRRLHAGALQAAAVLALLAPAWPATGLAAAQAGKAAAPAAASRQPLVAAADSPTLSGSHGRYIASVFVAVPAARAWSVLTSYEAMAGVMPDIKEAQVLSRRGPVVELQQTYLAPYTFGRRIKAVLTMREQAPRQLSYELVKGDMIRELRGTWTISPVRGGVILRHQIQLEPVLPDFLRPIYEELSEANLRQSMGILRKLMENG